MSSVPSKYRFINEYLKTPDESCFDFYRCYKCTSLITREQELRRRPSGTLCPCKSAKYSPSWPVRIDWLRPSVVRCVIKLVLARVVAVKFPSTQPSIERILAGWGTLKS